MSTRSEGEDTGSSPPSTSKRMGHDGTDKQSDRQTDGDGYELLGDAEALAIGLRRITGS